MFQNHFGRNDKCWCNSGIKFKRCHMGRSTKKPLPIAAILSQNRKIWQEKYCLHPQASSTECDAIIRSHTIQRKNTLESLVDKTNQVLTFHPFFPDTNGEPTVRKCGWKEASTFNGFCGKHDSIFAPVDTIDFEITKSNAFLLSYRSLSHEFYQKNASLKVIENNMKIGDFGRAFEEQVVFQRNLAYMAAGTRKAINSITNYKHLADSELISGNFSAWNFAIFEFSGDLSFAASGAVSPNVDLNGRSLQVLHDRSSLVEYLCVSMSSRDGGLSITLGWRTGHAAPASFVDSLLKKEDKLITSALSQFIIAHIENSYFSSDWWGQLSYPIKNHVQSLFTNTNPYYDKWPIIEHPIVPWKLTSKIIL